MQADDIFSIHQNPNTEEDRTVIKPFITRDNEEEEFNEKSEWAGATEEPECSVSNYLEFVDRVKQLVVFTLQKDDTNGFSLLKTAEIYFEHICSNNTNLYQTKLY